MKTYNMVIKLLSDTLPGSGDTFTSYVDVDIIFDNYGIPYIPARRVKGILRESAEELDSLFDKATINMSLKNFIGKFLGTRGNWESGLLSISNFYIPSYLETIKLLEDNTFSIPFNYTMDYFTIIRKQTSMDEEYRLTKDGSLRTVRLLKKDLAFSGTVSLEPEYENQFAIICAYTNKLGSNKKRGFGTIKIELYNEDNPKENLIPEAIKHLEETING